MEIADLNILYDAFRASLKGSAWKREPLMFEHNWLAEIVALKHELETRTYHTLPGTEFTLNERGKIRHIHGGRMRDRVVRHALCDEILTPCLKPFLIHDNGASQKGKGLSFSRQQFEKDLHNFYLEYGDNNGYVGFLDLSKFYDNIQHDLIKKYIYPHIPEDTHWLMDEILDTMKIDVSFMSDEEYAGCMEQKFDSVAYYRDIPKEARTGEKYMRKSVNIGDQVSQNIGVFFPHRIDNYAKIVRGIKKYGRYMDDVRIIHREKEVIESVFDGIRNIAAEDGLYINERKTRIVPLSGNYKYLQIRYSLSDTGRVIKRINQKSVTRERQKVKSYKHLLDDGEMQYPDVEQACKSWMGDFTRIMSKKQINNMKELYYNLFGKEIRWKQS